MNMAFPIVGQSSNVEAERKDFFDADQRNRRILDRAEHEMQVAAANAAWRAAVRERVEFLARVNPRIEALHKEFKRLKEMKV
jgi:transposase